MTSIGTLASTAARSRACVEVRCWGRNTITDPRSASRGGDDATASIAARTRSCSELNRELRCSVTLRWIRTTSAARAEAVASRRRPDSSTSESSRWARTRALSVVGWCSTPVKCPGSEPRTALTAPAMTGVDTGRRPVAATAAAPSNSASRYVVKKVVAAKPDRPRARRAATPT
jgi:hypothetical protein